MSSTSDDIRKAFLSFFHERGHEVVPSGPLVPPNDPTLMFANAGMVQFKDLFTGREKRSYTRATSSQKCIRISGKHNDLEAVGPSPRHHTFFEMLGNFSFGDYFKEEAIVYAWDLLGELGVPKDRLVCTYFAGEKGFPADEAARELWKKVTGFGDDRILGLGMDENFWRMGDTGPCGPSSEIHIFNGPGFDPGTFGEEQTSEGFGWMEIWNLVFMQFELLAVHDDRFDFKPLPAPSIDTGAGLERLTSVLMGKTSNYETDLLRALVGRAAELSNKPYGGSMAPDDVSMRVIADHARTTAFLIAEGVLPDRVERPYVLRRVMRRAVRHGHRLGISEPFLHKVADKVIDLMGEQYPELRERRDLILTVTEQEEVRFRQTIERGLGLLDEQFERMDKQGDKTLGGSEAFTLYDTYGFPLDLTEVICTERGYSVDKAGYDAALEEARRRSEFKGREQAVEGVYREALESVPGGAVAFSGYDRDAERAPVLAIIRDGALADSASEGDRVEIVTPRTPFYGESGGQVGDTGRFEADSALVEIEDTQKPLTGLVVHRGVVTRGTLEKGAEAELEVDVRAPRSDPAQPFGDAPPASGSPHRARRARPAEGLAGRAGTAALRLHARKPAHAGGDDAHRGHGQRARAGERAGADRDHEHGRGAPARCDDDLRGEVRRHRAHADHGRLGGAVRWYACARHGRHRTIQDHRRAGHRRRRAAHHRHHRGWLARLSARAGAGAPARSAGGQGGTHAARREDRQACVA